MDFPHVLVVGAGQMGSGIAQVVAASGRRVSLYDSFPEALDHARADDAREPRRSWRRRAAPTRTRRSRASRRSTELVAADLMIEAVVEDAAVKEDVFRRADAALPPHAVLASNTSSIPIATLAAATSRPAQVVGMHFFNPVPLLKLVEVIRAEATSDETAAAVVALARELGKEPVEARDVAGLRLEPDPHAVHQRGRVCAPGRRRGGRTRSTTVAKLGFGHPIGPLALADLIGLDTCVAIMEVLHARARRREVRAVPAARRARPRPAGSDASRAAGFYTYE